MHANNIGDPFDEDNSFRVNTKSAEKAVLKHYANLWQIDDSYNEKGDPNNYWGYVLTMGSTEGNMYAMYNAREFLTGCDVVPMGKNGTEQLLVKLIKDNGEISKEPVVFYTSASHYSIAKAARILRV